MRPIALCAALLCVSAASARNYSDEWKSSVLIHSQLTFDQQAEPDFLWRRVRFAFAGPITDTLKAKLQIDGSHEAIDWFDLYLDFTPVPDPVQVNLKAGLFFPNWAHEGVTWPETVNYSYLTTTERAQLRNFGAQAAVRFGDIYRVSAGVFNGIQGFDDTNGRPDYVFAFEALPPWFDCRAWVKTGWDGTSVAPLKTQFYSFEITNAYVGDFWFEGAFGWGRSWGNRFVGAYAQGSYQIGPNDSVHLKYDWTDPNRDVPMSDRLRYIGSYHHRWSRHLETFCDVEIDQATDDVRAILFADFRY